MTAATKQQPAPPAAPADPPWFTEQVEHPLYRAFAAGTLSFTSDDALPTPMPPEPAVCGTVCTNCLASTCRRDHLHFDDFGPACSGWAETTLWHAIGRSFAGLGAILPAGAPS